MNSYESHLRAAEGFLELGMPLEANAELESIEPKMLASSGVLIVRVQIYQRLEKWDLMAVVAEELCKMDAEQPRWTILFAYAARRSQSLEAARKILTTAAATFPGEGTIHYNLACYEAQLGNLVHAHAKLVQAGNLEPSFRLIALHDPDLEPLRVMLGLGSEE